MNNKVSERSARILVISVDHELGLATQVKMENLGYHCALVNSPAAAGEQLRQQQWQILVLALGRHHHQIDIATHLSRWPTLPVVVASSDDAGQSDPANGFTRICRDDPECIRQAVESELSECRDGGARLIASDPTSVALVSLAARVAATSATVLLSGETGVGKEVFARYIHTCSAVAAGPFVAINCAAIPETMLEAQMFGHDKGAFTGANTTRTGTFERANYGTLLLDEISEMDLGLQAKLLRVLQENEFERIGGSRPIALNVRVLATTNRNLVQAVERGEFRQDLYYRLSVFPVAIPPLRERPDDIIPLARRLLALQTMDAPRRRLASCAQQALAEHSWPGNVRELSNVIQRALILSPALDIYTETIHQSLLPGPNMGSSHLHLSALAPALQLTENEVIMEALKSGNRKQAADKLGISGRTLRYKIARMRKAGIPVPG